jgi:hypothetical protein
MDQDAVLAIALVLSGLALILWLSAQSEKMGVDSRPWRMVWVCIIIVAAFGVYVILINQ